jgi:DNA-binding IclR family transcriptional regulator
LVTEEEIYAFVRDSIGSVWALELLLFLRRGHERAWSSAELVRELRSSDTAITDCLTKLVSLGVIVSSEAGYQYKPGSSQTAHAVDELQRLYAAKPISVMKAIMTAPNEKLRIFSNAFRLKD